MKWLIVLVGSVILAIQFQAILIYVFSYMSRSRAVSETITSILLTISDVDSDEHLDVIRSLNKLQTPVPSETPFPCKTEGFRSPTPPTSVHQLRPGDIDIVAAIGDSNTAGNAIVATNVNQLIIRNMGFPMSIGGQGTWREYLTVPNILKVFNPKLFGFSHGSRCMDSDYTEYNMAFGGAVDEDLLGMAKELVEKMKSDPRVDFNKHWKLVTVSSGGNNLCTRMCKLNRSPSEEADNHLLHLQQALDYLHQNLPRTFINLVSLPDVEKLRYLTGRPLRCHFLKYLFCSCFFGSEADKSVDRLVETVRLYHEVEQYLGKSGRYDTRDDFTLVYQPFTSNLTVPTVETEEGSMTDYTFLAHDCFHFSQKAHARGANSLWNNMMEPDGKKMVGHRETFERFLCPTEDSPYFFTKKNSEAFIRSGKQ